MNRGGTNRIMRSHVASCDQAVHSTNLRSVERRASTDQSRFCDDDAVKPQIVFAVDDDELTRESIRRLLSTRHFSVQVFVSALDFLERADVASGDCLITDIRMPRMSGVELLKELALRGAALPTIVLTGYGDVPLAVAAMKAGAVDFLSKPFREQDILESIQAALRREQTRHSEELAVSAYQASYRSLTQREREIMRLVVAGQINKQIAAAVGLSEVTVKIHRAQVMHKMGTPSLADLVRAADKIEAFLS